MASHLPPLATLLPPLVCGTATFTSQYNQDPFALPTTSIVHRALSLGIRAFDTSPYYGPAERLLGQALDMPFVHDNFTREDYLLLTKVGRIGTSEFDYSPSWVRQSVQNSLARLRTNYLDVIYCHDVEFVSPEEVFSAVCELRKIRDESGALKYIGISGYPVESLCSLSELVLARTGEPLDAVMSYANYTVQNTRLASTAISRLKLAGVGVVLNASVLGMGLLRRTGVPIGSQGDFHPSPVELRKALKAASDWCDSQDERIENISMRFSLENWIKEGESVGSKTKLTFGVPLKRETVELEANRLGISVIGVSNIQELEETLQVWHSILKSLQDNEQTAVDSIKGTEDFTWSLSRKKRVQELAAGIRQILGTWVDFTWDSPPPGFVNLRYVCISASTLRSWSAMIITTNKY